MTDYASTQRLAAELQMSETMGMLAQLAASMPLDVTNADDLHTALCATTVPLIRALDAGRIHFEQDKDNALFHGLLMTALQVCFNGRFGETETARVQ